MSFQLLSLSSLFSLCLTISILTHPSSSAVDSFVYGGCSQQKIRPGHPYETNVNSLLTSLVNSAAFATYNNFKISVPGSGPNDVVYGIFQCRGDVRNSDCRECVSRSDKSVVMKKCGPSIGYDSDTLTRRDGVLDELAAGGSILGWDCLAEAIGRLKSECGPSAWGDMFLGKCYARYSERGDYSRDDNGYHDHHDDHDNIDDNETEKTLAILIGLIAGVSLLIFFLSVLRRSLDKKGGK
ncbi:plasmodesmata-located protein 6 [Actinidia rufa]|uniref:Plasmodesmata-located protein 6 n=1 Tax=Actinidia rufa TaxID=165716 RepID=A0A7J0DQX1_9ERIC|nr:plasmodesmata-located protein 6 [Actinidia rufa]